MKKTLLLTILFLAFIGFHFFALAQSEEDFEREGLEHFERAYLKAMPRKNRALADQEFARAEKAFQKDIEKNSNNVKAYLHLGLTYSAQKKYAAAAETFRSALTVAPQHKRIYLQLASALEKNGDYRGAIDALVELRTLESDARAIRVIDDFIGKLEKRAAGSGSDTMQSGDQP